MSARAREALRRRFRPARVRVMFVGEAPPASGRFFYAGDSGLFRAIRRTFGEAFPDVRAASAPAFLDQFRDLGAYLFDLCAEPVDRLTAGERERARTAGEPRLVAALRALRPAIAVTMLKSIAPVVERAAIAAGWNGELVSVPYPGQWHAHRVAFAATMIPLLRQWRADRLIELPTAARVTAASSRISAG